MNATTSQNIDKPEIDHGQLQEDILAKLRKSLAPASPGERLWISLLVCMILAGIATYAWQCLHGLAVTGMREYVSWGVYMTNFVFFIGVSHAGTLISAILRVTGAECRRSVTRMAEAITVFALSGGAPMVIVDMGRPDLILKVFIDGRLNSPILWDVCAICTYLSGSLLYLYVAMIPDFAILAPKKAVWERRTWWMRVMHALSLGYTGTPEQKRLLERALATMAVIIIPVAISVHTVVSWIFGMTLRPGWHSTIFGPYFVIGAIFSGTAAIITAMVIFRKAYHLETYLRPEHFHKLAKILLVLSLLYAYFTLSEYLTTWYGGAETDVRLLALLAGNGTVGAVFWAWATFGLFVPIGLLLFPSKRSMGSIMTASILINIGMWIKRYLIIVPTLETPFIPAQNAGITPHYFPSLIECTITAGAFAGFVLLYILFSRIFPILSIWETAEDLAEVKHAPAPAPVRVHGRAMPAALPLLLVEVGLSVLAPWTTARAQAPAAPASSTKIDLKRTTEDKEEMLVATVTANATRMPGRAP